MFVIVQGISGRRKCPCPYCPLDREGAAYEELGAEEEPEISPQAASRETAIKTAMSDRGFFMVRTAFRTSGI